MYRQPVMKGERARPAGPRFWEACGLSLIHISGGRPARPSARFIQAAAPAPSGQGAVT